MDRKGFIKQSGSLLLLTSINKLGMHQHSLANPPGATHPSGKSICTTCGTQFPPSQPLPDLCPICNDDRQYINDKGQTYITTHELNKQYSVKISKKNEHLYSIKMTPDFAIGQRAFLVISPGGNVLWDCIPLLNEAIIAFINSKGGLKAIAFSHPHYYSNMNEWAAEFNCPVFIHKADEEWIQDKTNNIQLWDGNAKPLWDNINIINIGGHFPGSSVLYLPAQSAKGTLLCGDTFYIAHSKRHVAVMHSYPNQILLTKKEFASVYKKSEKLEFDALLGAFEGQEIIANAKEVFEASMKRYLKSYEI